MMKKVIYILIVIACWYACSDDEPVIPEISGISFSDFLDVRDSSVYQCITIGGQTWMAENLHYRHPWGSFAGCYSYMESQLDTTDFNANGKDFYQAVRKGISAGDITIPNSAFNIRLNMVNMGSWSVSQFCTFCDMTYNDAVLLSYINTLRKELELEVRDGVAMVNLEKAEQKNGGYKDKYGFLYTYEGAKAALPAGWELPTDEDWKELEQSLGMNEHAVNEMEAWRGTFEGTLLKEGENGIGFNVRMGGGKLYGMVPSGSAFRNRQGNAYFWTSTETALNDSTSVVIVRKFAYDNDRIFRTTAKTYQAAYSVRGIKR